MGNSAPQKPDGTSDADRAAQKKAAETARKVPKTGKEWEEFLKRYKPKTGEPPKGIRTARGEMDRVLK